MSTTLERIYIYLTKRCNMSCRHCYLSAGPDVPDQGIISTEQYVAVVGQCMELGLRSVKVTGGEPLLHHEKALAILEQSAALGLKPVLETNGLMVSEAIADRLARIKDINVGISLDSMDAETSDNFRQSLGAHKRVVGAIDRLVQRGAIVTVLVSVFRSNFDEMSSFADWMINDHGVSSVKFSPVISIGRATDMDDQALSPSELAEFARRMVALADRLGKKVTTILPFSLANPVSTPKLALGRCDISTTLGVGPAGEIMLCGIGLTNPETVFGNILDTNVTDVWRESEYLEGVRQIRHYEGVCSECIFQSQCANGCVAYAYSRYGSFHSPNPMCQSLYDAGLFPAKYLIGGSRACRTAD